MEEADPQRQIRIGEQLHGLRLGEAHVQRVDVLLDGSLLQQPREHLGRPHQPGVLDIRAHNDPAGVEVVVERLALPQEFRAEEDVVAVELLPDAGREAHGDGGLDDHNGLGIALDNQPDHILHRGGVEKVLLAVVVGRRGNDHEVRVGVGLPGIQRGGQIQFLPGQVLLDVLVLDGGFPIVDQLHLLGHNVHRGDLVMLGKQRGDGQPHIPGARHRDFQVLKISHSLPHIPLSRQKSVLVNRRAPT